MTQMPQGPYGRPRARNNIFTVLIFVAFVVLACGIGYIWIKHHQLYKTHPFGLVDTNRR